MDIHIQLSNGQTLSGFIKSPGENIKAGIVMVHGLGEHIRRYSDWADKFIASGFGFTGVDLPGHGKSDGRRGVLNSYKLTAEMIDIEIRELKKTFPGIPIFLYGHSLGGTIVLQYVLQKKPPVKGVIVTSPWLRLSFEPSKAKLKLVSIMKGILPSLVQPSGLNIDHISHDHKVVEAYKNDPLNHNKISVGLVLSTISAANYSLSHASELKLPLLLIHGSDDLITSPEGSREFAAATPLAELKIWPGGYHELHNESFRDDVFAFIENWINSKL
jgi:acylglycerol lipase